MAQAVGGRSCQRTAGRNRIHDALASRASGAPGASATLCSPRQPGRWPGRPSVGDLLDCKETGAPDRVKPVEWRLLTNRAAQTLDDLVELIEWYRCRWEIETFVNVLKNGCRVEALQLGSVGKIELALAVYMVVSWRLARLVRLGRTHPDLAATALH